MHDETVVAKSIYFDANWYLDNYEDVKNAGYDPALHYLRYGAAEGRDPSRLFSTSAYKRKFPELLTSGENPLVHFARHNKAAARTKARRRPQSSASANSGESIPKIFHSVWLSGEIAPGPLRLGRESFARHHPDFKIRDWTLADLESDETQFLREALDQRKWAFATDYIRLKALYECGGVYADGDVSFYDRLEDYLGYDSVFCWENHFAIGPHFLMAKPGNALIGRLLEIYRSRSLWLGDELDLTPMPVITTWVLTTEFGLILDGSRQLLGRNDLVERENVFTTNFDDDQCIAEHLYYGGWTPEHGGSYKDALLDIAARWAEEDHAPGEERRKAISTSSMLWSYYFLKNAQIAFPAIGELAELEPFRALKQGLLGGCLTPRRAVLEAVHPADPLRAVSKWHVKPRLRLESAAAPLGVTRAPDPAALSVLRRGKHKISVVVPIYNVENYLVRCLKSIQAQSHTDFEALLIDDGSTDGSTAIAREICAVDPRFKYFRKPNGGLGDARNYAIPHLQSDLVTFMDSDDFLSADHLEKLEALFQQGFDLAICNFRLTTPDGRVIETRELTKFWGENDPIVQALVSNYECYAWNKMYTTETFTKDENARYSLGWFEDFALTPALIARSRKLGFVDSQTYNYVQRPDSILSTARKNVARNIEIFNSLKMLMKHKDSVPEKYWNVYMSWMAPKHYFYWRIVAILSEKSHGNRVAAASAFSEALNVAVPDWEKSPYIDGFVREPADPQVRRRREALVEAFCKNDLAFYALARDISQFAL
jgi:glycosyltransferase involved in cell wall biosynthesis